MLLTLLAVPCTLRKASRTLRLSQLSNLYPLSQLERASGVMAMSLSAAACCPLPCQHCLCKRHVRCLGRETEGLWYETCWRQWKEKACVCCTAQAHKRASCLVCSASLHGHVEGLSCVCCPVLGNARRGETVGHQPHGPLLSPRERAGRDQDHGAWLTARKETHDATASDHDP